MRKRRFVSAFLAMAQVFSINLVFAQSSEKTVTDYSIVLVDEGDNAANWAVASGINPTVEQCVEEGTDYIRMIPSAALDYLYIKLPGDGIKIEDKSMIEIDMRIRGYEIDNGGGRMQVKWNMPEVSSDSPTLIYNGTDEITGTGVEYDSEQGCYKTSYGAGGNHLVLVDFLNSSWGVRLSNGIVSTMPDQTAWNTNLKNYIAGKINNKWWRVVVEMKPGYKMTYKLYDENDVLVGSEQTGTLGWVEPSGYLRNIAIQSFNGKLQYADIDYLKVSAFEKGVTAELLGAENTDNGYEIKLDDSFKVKFSLPMDESTLTAENIQLINLDTLDNVEINTEYDENVLTVIPKEDLNHGNYKIKLSSNIKTKELYPTKEQKYLSLEETDLGFRYYATNPPVAEDVGIEGISSIGETITGRYEYLSEDEVLEYPDGSLFKWYISDNIEAGYVAIEGENENTLIIEESFSDKFIKFGVTPKDETGMTGTEVLSEAFAAPSRPVASDVAISGNLVNGQKLTASFSYSDSNNDREGNTKFQWYISENADEGFTAIDGAVGRTYTLTDEDVGKYIKVEVTPVAINAPFEGKTVESASRGPVIAGLAESTNIVSENIGFELGTTANWTAAADQTIEIVEDAHTGKYALEVSVANRKWGYPVAMKANTAYLVSIWAKSTAGSKAMYWYSWNGARSKDFDTLNYNTSGKEGTGILAGTGTNVGTEWTNVSDIMVAYNNFSATPAIVYWGNTSSFIVDDLYIGELMISEIDVDIPEKTDIPLTGETKITLKNTKVKNQLGITVGFENASVKYELLKDVPGVRIDTEDDGTNTLVVTNYATVGNVEIKVTCDPYGDTGSVKYMGVEKYETLVSVNLEGNGNTKPQVVEPRLSGNVKTGDILTLDYTFYQLYGDADKSEITWWYSKEKTGEFEQIAEISGKSYKIPAEKADGYFKVKIVPKTDSDEGVTVWTNTVGKEEAPTAGEVTVSGEAFIGRTLNGDYKYSDFNEDNEGETKFRWLRADSEKGTYNAIDGATEKTYILTEADVNKYIKFEVTPVSVNEPKEGTSVLSDAFIGPTPPEAKNVKITKSANAYVGSYEYYQAGGAQEGKSIYKWIVDGSVVSNDISYTPSFSGRKNVIFEVTPVSVEEPSVGESVSVSMVIGKSLSGGGGGGSSSSGSVGTPTMIGVTTAADKITQNTASISSKMTDINNHWGYEQIVWALDNNIMEGISATTFAPDSYATRKEIITYMAKILKWEKSEYKGIFSDVEGEFGDLLQTFVDKGVISVDIKFRPDDNLTRQEMCKIIALALNMQSQNKENTTFADNADIGEWAIPHVNAVYEAGLIKGVGNNMFSPKGNVTRAQLATLLERIAE